MCWPQSLGGWGVPGKPEAPTHFRKAAASILSQPAKARDEQKKLLSTFVVSAAPKNLRKILDRQVEMVSNLPEQLSATEMSEEEHGPYKPVPLRDAVGTTVARTLSFYSLDPESSKLETRKAATVGEIARRIRRTIDSYATRWKSVKPIDPHKAIQLDRSLTDRPVDLRGIDNMLYYTGTPDVMIHLVRRELRNHSTPGFVKPETPDQRDQPSESLKDSHSSSQPLLQGGETAQPPLRTNPDSDNQSLSKESTEGREEQKLMDEMKASTERLQLRGRGDPLLHSRVSAVGSNQVVPSQPSKGGTDTNKEPAPHEQWLTPLRNMRTQKSPTRIQGRKNTQKRLPAATTASHDPHLGQASSPDVKHLIKLPNTRRSTRGTSTDAALATTSTLSRTSLDDYDEDMVTVRENRNT